MSRPLRVCHVAYTFYENDNRVIRYAEALAARGDAVDVIALRRHGQSRTGHCGRVRILRIQRRTIDERGAQSYLLKILWFFVQASVVLSILQLRHRYDVVHVHNVPDFLVFTAWLPKLMGGRVILDIHDVLPELYAGKFGVSESSRIFRALLAVERLSSRFANHVIVANHLWHDKLIRRSVVAERLTTVMNYPDLAMFRPLGSSPERRQRPFTILYPGTLNHHQGLDIAIRAFARAVDRMPGAEFHIYGEGPARRSLENLVAELGLQGRVHLHNRVPLEDVCRLMASADVGVVPKRADGFGNEAFSTKILEFMACGVPVIVSKTQIDAYYFNDEVVKFFTPGDEAQLADAMVWAYVGRDDRQAMVKASRQLVGRYSWQERVGDYLGIVALLVAKSSRAYPEQIPEMKRDHNLGTGK